MLTIECDGRDALTPTERDAVAAAYAAGQEVRLRWLRPSPDVVEEVLAIRDRVRGTRSSVARQRAEVLAMRETASLRPRPGPQSVFFESSQDDVGKAGR